MSVNRKDDRGVVLPLFALALVLVLLMVAFAVDLGAVAERRRSSQNMSDAAALAAAQQLGNTGAKYATGSARTDAIAAAADVAKRYIASNGGIAVDAGAWASCTDSNALAQSVASTPCISFSSDLTQVRVRVPDETVEYQFASIAGIADGVVRSAAIAEVISNLGGTTRPILLKVGQSGLNCVEAGGGGPETPCQGARLGPGDFGSMTSPRYTVLAGQGDDVNFALGLDHMLKLGPTDGKNYCDADGPNGVRNKCQNQVGGDLNDAAGTHDNANYVVADSGGELKDVTVGLVGEGGGPTFSAGGQTITALLYRPDGAAQNVFQPPGSPATPHTTFEGKTGLNGVHVSRYLTTAAKTAAGCSSAPSAMSVQLRDPGYDACNASLSSYITANVNSGQVLFTKDITASPRFGVAPVTDTLVNGSSEVAKVVSFYGIYLDRIYGNPSGKVKTVQAFVFPLSMIEPVSTGPGPGLPYLGGPFGVRLIQ